MNTVSNGNIWFYEWYPNGKLVTTYAGNIYYPGWYKRWFYADVPGWHILLYYCNGWSNYAYVYINGPSYWVDYYPNTITTTDIIIEPPTQNRPSILPTGPTQNKPSILPTGPAQKPSIQPTGPSTITTPPISPMPSITPPKINATGRSPLAR